MPLITNSSPPGDNGGGQVGPFLLDSGYLLAFIQYYGDFRYIRPHRSTDEGDSWSERTPHNFGATVYALWAELDDDGDTVHVAAHVGGGVVKYCTYTASTDTWSSEETVHTNANGDGDGFGVVVRKHPTTGNLWFMFQGDAETVFSINRLRVYITERTAANTYSTPVKIDGSVETADDNRYFTTGDMLFEPDGALLHTLFGNWHVRTFHRAITPSTQALGTLHEIADNDAVFAVNAAKRLAYTESGGVRRVTTSWRGSPDYPMTALVEDNAEAAPEEAIEAVSLAVWDDDNSAAFTLAADADAATVYAVYADAATGSVWVAANVDGAGWGTPALLVEDAAARWVGASIYPLSTGEVALAVLYDVAGDGLYYTHTVIRDAEGAVTLASAITTGSTLAADLTLDADVSLSAAITTGSTLHAQLYVPETGRLVIKVYIDFDKDGSFETSGDDISAYVKRANISVGGFSWGKLIANAGAAELGLDNQTKRFSPANASGPLYGKLLPGLPARVDLTNGLDIWTLFTGETLAWVPDGALRGTREATLKLIDGMGRMQRVGVETALLENTTADVVIQAAAEAVFGEDVTLDLETGLVPISVAGDQWSEDETNGAKVVEDAAKSEGVGLLWVARDGTVVFRNKDWLFTRPVQPSALTLVDDQDNLQGDLSGDDVVNRVLVTFTPRDEQITGVVARSVNMLEIPARAGYENEAKTFRFAFVDPATGEPAGAKNLIAPAAFTDYTVWEQPAMIRDYTSRGYISTTVEATGSGVECAFSNSSYTPMYLTQFQVRGTLIVAYDEVRVVAEDQASIDAYSKKQRTVKLPLSQDASLAEGLASYLLDRFKTPTYRGKALYFAGITYVNGVSLFGLALGDLLTVTAEQAAVEALRFLISAARYTWNAGGYATVQFSLMDIDDRTYWILGDPVYGVLGSTTRLAL